MGKGNEKKKEKSKPQTGSTSANFHEANRSEYLAHFAFSSFGTSIPVPRPEDTGLDLYCTLTERVGQRIWPRAYYSVQVKSTTESWVFESPDSIRWLIKHPLPILLCVVEKREARLRVYHTSPRFYIWSMPQLFPTRLELAPGSGTDGRGTQWGNGSTFDLSAPILDFTIQDLLDDGFVEKAKSMLKFWIVEVEMENLRRMKAGVLNFKLPGAYRTGEPGTRSGWMIQGINQAENSDVERAVELLKEPLDWVSEQLFKRGDLLAGVRGMLLLRYLYADERHPPQSLSRPSSILNELLDRSRLNHVNEAIDSLGSMLDLTLLRSLGDRVGEHLSRVQRIQLTGKDVLDDDLAILQFMRELRRLYLVEASITNTGLKHLEGLSELQHLSLARTDVTDEGLRSLSGLTTLRYLDLSETKVTGVGAAHLENLIQLETLILDKSQANDDCLLHLGKLPALQELSLIGTQITDLGLEHLQASPRLRKVRYQETQISDLAHNALMRSLPGWIEHERLMNEQAARQEERVARQNRST